MLLTNLRRSIMRPPTVAVAGSSNTPPVAGYTQFLSATDITGKNDGDKIVTWSDSSVNGNNVTNGTVAQQPVYRPDSGQPYVDYTAQGGLVAASRVLPLTEFTVFDVIYNDFTSGDQRPWGWENPSSGTHGFALYNQYLYVIRSNGSSYDISLGTVQNKVKYIYCCTLGVGGGAAYLQGIQKNTTGGTAWTSDGSNEHVGSAGTGGAAWTGRYYEKLIYPSKLSQADRDAVIWWLAGRHGFNVKISTHTTAAVDDWLDTNFPAYTTPCPLWNAGNSPAYVTINFPTTRVYNVTADMPTNFNIGSTAMYDQDTSTATGSPAGSQNIAVNANSGSPGGLRGVSLGTVTVNATGDRRIWFAFSGSTYYGIKTLYFS